MCTACVFAERSHSAPQALYHRARGRPRLAAPRIEAAAQARPAPASALLPRPMTKCIVYSRSLPRPNPDGRSRCTPNEGVRGPEGASLNARPDSAIASGGIALK
eukprot:6202664-Pleurochrysis_carterae.AAC.1